MNQPPDKLIKYLRFEKKLAYLPLCAVLGFMILVIFTQSFLISLCLAVSLISFYRCVVYLFFNTKKRKFQEILDSHKTHNIDKLNVNNLLAKLLSGITAITDEEQALLESALPFSNLSSLIILTSNPIIRNIQVSGLTTSGTNHELDFETEDGNTAEGRIGNYQVTLWDGFGIILNYRENYDPRRDAQGNLPEEEQKPLSQTWERFPAMICFSYNTQTLQVLAISDLYFMPQLEIIYLNGQGIAMCKTYGYLDQNNEAIQLPLDVWFLNN